MVFKYFRVTPPEDLFGYYTILYNNELYQLEINFTLKLCEEWYKPFLSKLHHLPTGKYVNCEGYIMEKLPDDFFDYNHEQIIEFQAILNNNFKFTHPLTFQRYAFKGYKGLPYERGMIQLPNRCFKDLDWKAKDKINTYYNKHLDILILQREKKR